MMEIGRNNSVKLFLDVDTISITDGVYITQIGAVFENKLSVFSRFYYITHPGSAEADSLISDVFNEEPPRRYTLRSVLFAMAENLPAGSLIAVENRELIHTFKNLFKHHSINHKSLVLTWDDCFYEDEIDDCLASIEDVKRSFFSKEK